LQREAYLRHVECAGDGVQQRNARENNEAGDAIGDSEVEGSLQRCRFGNFETAQCESCNAHQLKNNEQVKKISGEREAGHRSQKH